MTADGHRDEAVDERGSVSLAAVLVGPILVLLMFAGFQAAMWNHARTEARAVARDTAVLVARDRLSEGDAASVVRQTLGGNALVDVDVAVTITDGNVVVTVKGRAPGILRGTSRRVSVSVAVPLEGWVPL
ncbi:MAG TPA: pilus assembly protein [Ilumatobacteraceae bacterium]|nr:pilus assembly protein [Ilumatobacteraceae bacterium]